jgi:hypothetical protein
VDSPNDRLSKALDEATEFARTFRFEMTDDYLALIEQVEALPRNQSGSDKSGRWLGSRADARALVQRATLLPPDR